MDLQQFITQLSQQFEASDMDHIHENVDYRSLETWDSLTSMSFQVMIEEEYKVIVTPAEIKERSSVLDLYKLVQSRMEV